jgi:hypothetical protein
MVEAADDADALLDLVGRAASTVVALVGDDLLDHGDRVIRHGGDGLELLGGFGQRLLEGGRVAFVGALHGDADDRARLPIDGVLGLVGQMRPAIRHLRDLRVGSGGASSRPTPRKSRNANESAARHAKAPLRVDALEIDNQEQPKINPGRQTRPAHRVGVERRALGLGEVIEPLRP